MPNPIIFPLLQLHFTACLFYYCNFILQLADQIHDSGIQQAGVLRKMICQMMQRSQVDGVVREEFCSLNKHQRQVLQHGFGGVLPELAVAAVALFSCEHGGSKIVDDAGGLFRIRPRR